MDTPGHGKTTQVSDADSPRFQPSFQTLPNAAHEELASRGEEEGEADRIGQDPRSEEKEAPQQDDKPFQEGIPWKPAPGQLSSDLPEGSKPLKTGQGSPSKTGEHHQPDRGPDTHPLADLYQDEQLQEGNPHKKEEKPAEQ